MKNTDNVNKIWSIIKTIVELILAAIGGAAVGTAANATGLSTFVQTLCL